jgi:hypothetical protein
MIMQLPSHEIWSTTISPRLAGKLFGRYMQSAAVCASSLSTPDVTPDITFVRIVGVIDLSSAEEKHNNTVKFLIAIIAIVVMDDPSHGYLQRLRSSRESYGLLTVRSQICSQLIFSLRHPLFSIYCPFINPQSCFQHDMRCLSSRYPRLQAACPHGLYRLR